MILIIIFLILVAGLMLLVPSTISGQRKGRGRETLWPDEDLDPARMHSNHWLLNHTGQDTLTSSEDHANRGDAFSNTHYADPGSPDLNSGGDFGGGVTDVDGGNYSSSVETGGGTDFGGFDGGGAGGSWSDSSN